VPGALQADRPRKHCRASPRIYALIPWRELLPRTRKRSMQGI